MSEIPLIEYDADDAPTRDIAEDRESFRIQDDQQAAWAMRKRAQYRAKMSENMDVAEAEMHRITEWLVRVNESVEKNAQYFEALLIDYARRQRQTDNRKTIDTPYGRVKSRALQVKYEVFDVDEFVNWAQQHRPELISVKISPDLRALKDAVTPEDTPTMGRVAVTEGGEVIPGVTFEPANVSFTFEEE
jgi:hypothetical protein